MTTWEQWIPPERLALEGSLEDRNLGEVLFQLWQEAFNGIVVLDNRAVQRAVLLRDGHIAFAYSNDPDDRLGEVLLLRGTIDVQQLEMATRQMLQTKKKLGAVLIELGILAPEELTNALRTQVETIVWDSLNFRAGTYRVYVLEPEESVPGMVDLAIETPLMVFEGARRVRRWSIVARGVGSLDQVPVLAPRESWSHIALSLTPEENHVLSQCNGRFSIRTICATSYLNSFETVRLLWALRLVHVLEFREPATAPAVSADRKPAMHHEEYQEYLLQDLVQRYNEMFQEIVETILEEIGEEGVRQYLQEVLAPIRAALPHRLKDVEIGIYGEIDYDTFVRNFAHLDFDTRYREMTSILEDILYGMIYGLQEILPESRARELQQALLERHRPNM